MKVSMFSRLRVGLLATLIAGTLVVLAAVLFGRETDRRRPEPSATATVVRLSGSQFLLNWQSFQGREAVVEFCTIRVTQDQRISCIVFNGAQRLGEIDVEQATFDPTSKAWATETCAHSSLSVACSIRLSGIIRRTQTGSAMIVRGKVLS